MRGLGFGFGIPQPGAGACGPGLWTPSELSPLEWYRADLANITLSPNVSALADLSGNGRHATQAVSGEQPTTGTIAGLNGAPAIVCNSTGLNRPTYSPPTPYTLFVAAEISAGPPQYAWLYCADGLYGCANGKYGTYNAVFSTMPTIGTAPVPIVLLYYVDALTIAGGLRVQYGGTIYTSSSGGIAPQGVYTLGYRLAGGQSVSCKIAETIVIPGTLTGAPLTSLSAYSTARYGMTF